VRSPDDGTPYYRITRQAVNPQESASSAARAIPRRSESFLTNMSSRAVFLARRGIMEG